MKKFYFLFFFLLPSVVISQSDISKILKDVEVSGLVSFYYAYDTDKGQSLRQFSAMSEIRNQFRIDLAQISAKYESDFIRGKTTFHFGDIPRYNWPDKMQLIQEAYVGVSPAKDFWIDAGYFITHIGGETFPMYNFFSTFAMSSYVEPFYQSGIKISYDFSEKFSASLHILNGYNVLEDNNENVSAGIQLIYTHCPNLKITYNNIIGNEMPKSTDGRTRMLNNLVVNLSPVKNLELIISGDYTFQEKSKLDGSDNSAFAYGTFISSRYKVHPKINLMLRGEYFSDPDGILAGVYLNSEGNSSGVKNSIGVTGGIEYKPIESSYFRLEARYLQFDETLKLFHDNSNSRGEVILSSGIEF